MKLGCIPTNYVYLLGPKESAVGTAEQIRAGKAQIIVTTHRLHILRPKV